MNLQLRLPGIDPPRQITASAERPVPAFWIRRILILRELSANAEHVVRDVVLRRGLNIIWTPPHAPTGDNALFKSGMTGHTAGKSTLCRFLRYVLGEHGFAPERARKRIRAKFPDGWVLGEVVLGEVVWAVARPLGVGAHPFCVKGGQISEILAETAERLDYRVFLDALERTTVEPLRARNYPSNDERVAWEHLLPWLSRDQECRFADFLQWRHSTSETESPSLKADARNFLVRSVLGLISDDEREEQLRNSRLVARKKEAGRLAPLLAHQATTDHQRVQRLLEASFDPPSSGLFGAQASDELRRQKAAVEAQLTALNLSDPKSNLRTAVERAIELEASARHQLQDAEGRWQMESAALQQITAPDKRLPSLLAGLGPSRGYCNVPMDHARRSGCPIASTNPLDLTARRSEVTAAAEVEQRQGLVDALRLVTEEKRQLLVDATKAIALARRAEVEAANSFEQQREPLLERRARLVQAERFVREAEEAWTNASSHAQSVDALEAEIEDSYVKQDQIRRASDAALGRLSSTYDYVVRAILGDEVSARIDASGRSLSLVIEHHGERESAAFATLKLLAFDLASMTESIEGRGAFPRFLLHDGPREADLAPEIYERLFLYARQLEDCFSGDPSFQYIVTTTTRPPESLLVEPWCRLKLSGVPAEERLLRCDL